MDWDQLVQQSEEGLSRDTQGFPRVERDIFQVADFSQKLRAKASAALDPSSTSLAATRLLAQEGLNTRKLNTAMQAVELQPTYEEVFPASGGSVEEYLRQVHEYTMVTALQDVQRDSARAFDGFLLARMELEFAADNRALLSGSAMDTSGGSQLATLAPMGAVPNPTPGGAVQPLTEAQQEQQATPGGVSGFERLQGRAKAYAEVVRGLNDDARSLGEGERARTRMQAVSRFAAAAAPAASEAEGGNSVQALWEVLAKVLAKVPDMVRPGPSGVQSVTEGLLRGARSYLEACHATYVQQTIQANRALASLGGSPTNASRIAAFVRVKEQDSGPLDGNGSPPGADPRWQRIFLCMRSGFYQEAVQEARGLPDGALVKGGTFAAALEAWVKGEGALPSTAAIGGGVTAPQMAHEADRLFKAADRDAWRRGSFRYRAALYALLSGDRRRADAFFREGGSLFATIEDFLWFKIALIRVSRPDVTPQGLGTPSSASPGGTEAYTLPDLQAYLAQFPAKHYSHDGREPLLYVTMLVLTAQFRAALAFLSSDPSAVPYRVDAPHLALALHKAKVLDAGGPGDVTPGGFQPSALVHRYAKALAREAPDVALEYYIQAAAMEGGSLAAKGVLLRELLTESNAFGFLLGGGSGAQTGALQRFEPDANERRQLAGAVAAACAAAEQADWAAELYLHAGDAVSALSLLNQQLSAAIEPGLLSEQKDEEVSQLVRRGQDMGEQLSRGSPSSPEASQQQETFVRLCTIRALLTADRRGDTPRVLQSLSELPLMPLEQFRLQRCLEEASTAPAAIAERLAAVLLAGGRALAATKQAQRLRVMAAFAGSLPQRVGRHVFVELNRLQNAVQ